MIHSCSHNDAFDQRQCLMMESQGFVRIPGYFDEAACKALSEEFLSMVSQWYKKEHLDRHAVYPSDRSQARESHAMMIANGESTLPKVEHLGFVTIERFLNDHHRILEQLTQTPVQSGHRSLINYQNYLTGSKPVGEHFDGEYLRAAKHQDGIEFDLLEGILPRYVSVLVLADTNGGRGVELVDHHSQQTFQPQLFPGDLVVFDNIRLRHRVPSLGGPRTSIGLRNMDHMPLHFVKNPDDFVVGASYRSIPEGWVSETVDCHSRMQRYFEHEWPLLRQDYAAYV